MFEEHATHGLCYIQRELSVHISLLQGRRCLHQGRCCNLQGRQETVLVEGKEGIDAAENYFSLRRRDHSILTRSYSAEQIDLHTTRLDIYVHELLQTLDVCSFSSVSYPSAVQPGGDDSLPYATISRTTIARLPLSSLNLRSSEPLLSVVATLNV
jgi:hypothetical protein